MATIKAKIVINVIFFISTPDLKPLSFLTHPLDMSTAWLKKQGLTQRS